MRVFFIGNVTFSEIMLKTLLDQKDIQIIGLATKSSSTFNSDHVDLSGLVKNSEIPWKYVRDINAPHIVTWITSLKPDLIFCLGWSSLIKKEILNIPPKGVIGFHPAKLPNNRGRHPIIWALALGLQSTASTFFKMDEGADTGDILSQKDITIEDSDTAESLYNKLIDTARNQLINFIPKLVNDTVDWQKQKQDDGNVWRKRSPKDGLIDFRMSSVSIYNLVRALSKPYPGADIMYKEANFKIWDSTIGNNNQKNLEPGKVINIKNNSIEVKTGDSSIWLLKHNIKPLPSTGDYIL